MRVSSLKQITPIWICIIAVTSYCAMLNGIIVPYSENPCQNNDNCISNFVRTFPEDSIPLALQTSVWLWHDKDNLFLQVDATIDSTFYKGVLKANDEWVDADYIRVQLITDVTSYYSYMYHIFPLGNMYDGIRKSDMNISPEWDSGYTYETKQQNGKWNTLVKIPFRDLRYSGKPPHNWKIIINRYCYNSDELYSFPNCVIEMGMDYYKNASDLIINEELKKDINLRISPYCIKHYSFKGDNKPLSLKDAGIDISYNQSTLLKVKLSVNPDYTDIPLDSEKDNSNLRYAPTYSENRYFFIDDLSVFDVGNKLFNSRNIMKPLYSFKVTGNSEKLTYGYLFSRDQKVEEDSVTYNDDDSFNLLAVKRKWEKSSLQISALNRMNKGYNNEVLQLNPNWEFARNHRIWTSVNYSFRDFKAEKGVEQGYCFTTGYSGQSRKIYWNTEISSMSRDFRADMGSLYETDIKYFSLDYSQEAELHKKWIHSFGTSAWYYHSLRNDSSDLIEMYGGANLWVMNFEKVKLNFKGNIGVENYGEIDHNWFNSSVSCRIDKYPFIKQEFKYNRNNELIYQLNSVHKSEYFSVMIWGNINKNMYYNANAQMKVFAGIPENSGIDDQYWLCNADFTINLEKKINISNGIRFNNNSRYSQTSYLGFFTNLRYSFKQDCHIFFGYKSINHEEKTNFETDLSTAYMKVVYTF
jgi:hypothetical protein